MFELQLCRHSYRNWLASKRVTSGGYSDILGQRLEGFWLTVVEKSLFKVEEDGFGERGADCVFTQLLPNLLVLSLTAEMLPRLWCSLTCHESCWADAPRRCFRRCPFACKLGSQWSELITHCLCRLRPRERSKFRSRAKHALKGI